MPERFPFGRASGGEPAPVVSIVLTDEVGRTTPALLAIVDTGADGTLVPLSILQDAGFIPSRARRNFVPGGVGYSVESVRGYDVTARIGALELMGLEVYGSSLIREMILGRDVLNQLVFTYDGPKRVLEILTT